MRNDTTIGRAMLGGLAGTLMMTAMMYVAAPMMGLQMDIAGMLGSMLGGSWTAGLMMHLLNGVVVFPLVFTLALASRLPGSWAVRGALWGGALWLIAQLVVMPMMGGGIFSSAMGGPMAAMASLVGHLLYGGVFGAVAGSREPRIAHA